MIGLDTDVLVRYVMQHDPRQSPRATRLIESLSADEPRFVPLIALVDQGLGKIGTSNAVPVQRLGDEFHPVDHQFLAAQEGVQHGGDLRAAQRSWWPSSRLQSRYARFDAAAVKATSLTLVP